MFDKYKDGNKLTNKEINIFLQLLRALLTTITCLEIVLMFYLMLIVIFIGREEVKLGRLKRLKNEK